MSMVGRTYTWRSGACSTGVWRVVCRWAGETLRNVLAENVETGERVVRPWYPAPRRVAAPSESSQPKEIR